MSGPTPEQLRAWKSQVWPESQVLKSQESMDAFYAYIDSVGPTGIFILSSEIRAMIAEIRSLRNRI